MTAAAGDVALDDQAKLRPGDAAAAIIIAPGERYVLQLRDDKSGIFYPGHWGCFGGAIEPGDATVAAGLRRELAEELGLELSEAEVTFFTNITFDFTFCGLGVLYRAFYEVRLDERQLASLRLGEGSAFDLFTARAALSQPRLVPYDAWALWMHANRRRLGPGG
jgi:8-oxo-dGTP pyrophosphatase MutT (NUDIX family)